MRRLPAARASWPPLEFPVLTKELRLLLRGDRVFKLLGVAVILGILIAVGVIKQFLAEHQGVSSLFGGATGFADIGRNLFAGVLLTICAVSTLLAPGLAAVAVTHERERGSLELLYLTSLTSRNILLGKLLSTLWLVAMLQLCTLPLAALAFTFGGVSPGQVGWGMAMLFALALAFGSIGLYCSTRCARTATAVAASYAACLGWLLFMPGIAGLHAQTFNYGREGLWVLSVPGVVIAAGLGWLTMPLVARRRLPFAVRLGGWVVCSIGWALLMLPLNTRYGPALNAFLYMNPEYLLAGNPLASLVNLLDGWERIYSLWYTPPWVAYGYSPGMVTLHVIIAAGLFTAARRRLDAKRAVTPSASRRG